MNQIKKGGLIAQEVELIVPEVEVVRENEMDKIKCLLVEAIKQLNNKVIKLENIFKNNNLN